MDIKAFLRGKYISFFSLHYYPTNCGYEIVCISWSEKHHVHLKIRRKNFYIHSRFERKQVHWINESTFDILLMKNNHAEISFAIILIVWLYFWYHFLTKLKHMRPILWNEKIDILVLFMVVFYFKVNKLYPLWKKKSIKENAQS